jgi:CBS domain containing-hemolysin-like protein
MPEDSSSAAPGSGGSFWKGLRTFLFGDDGETTLRDQIEEVIESREGERPAVGDLTHVERQMLKNLLHFGERTADDLAVPRGEIVAVPSTIGFEALVAAFAEAGHSRLPVYEGSLDKVVGMIHLKDVFALQVSGGEAPDDISVLYRTPLYVPESMGVL